MKATYLLVANSAWAKLYKTDYPFTKLELVAHQIYFVGVSGFLSVVPERDSKAVIPPSQDRENFARSVCKLLNADYQAGKFEHLAIIASGDFIAAIQRHFYADNRETIFGMTGHIPGRFTQQELLVHLRGILPNCGGMPELSSQEKGS